MTEPERQRRAPAPTGDSRVDAVIQGLASIEHLDLAERPAVLETVHSRLRELLGELGDTSPAGSPRPGSPSSAAPQPGSWRPRPGS